MDKSHFLNDVFCNKYTVAGPRSQDFTQSPRPYYTFAYVLEGRLECIENGRTVVGEVGDVLFFPYHLQYVLRWAAEKNVTYSFHFLLPSGADPLADKVAPLQVLRGTDSKEEFAAIFRDMQERERILGALGRFYGLCDTLFRQLSYTKAPSIDARVRRVMKYIYLYYQRPLSVEQLAALVQLSPSRFYALFKKETGFSPIAYKNRVAVRHGAMLLAGERSVEEIAAETGFASSAYFRRTFKAVTGLSPREYRKGLKLR